MFLVTIRGPGGIGKTRLAREVARSSALVGGAWFCEVAEASRATVLATQLATILGIDALDDPIESVGRALNHRGPTLLVLDNCEWALDACAELLDAWRDLAPEARFLATSRRPLGLAGEVELELGPLSDTEAAQLFQQRARAAGDPALVRAIAQELEGLPLAIELAAARTSVLGLGELRLRLNDALSLLRSRRRDRPTRHLSVGAAIDDSYESLSKVEQGAFAQCAVFRGGFDLSAAEAVLRLGEGVDILDTLETLRDHSLLTVHHAGSDVRFGVYAVLRQYGEAKLQDGDALGERHASYYVAAGERWADALHGPGIETAFAQFSSDLDNLRAAHERSLLADRKGAARIALAMSRYLAWRGPRTLRRELLRSTAEMLPADPALAISVRISLADAEGAVGATEEASEQLDAILNEMSAHEEPENYAAARLARGRIRLGQRGVDARLEDLTAALDAYVALNRPHTVAETHRLMAHGFLAAGDLTRARVHSERASELARELGEPLLDAWCGNTRAVLHHFLGDLDEAEVGYAAARAQFAALGQRRDQAVAAGNHALICLEQGRFDEACTELSRTRDIYAEVGDLGCEAQALVCLAEHALFERAWARAASFVEAAFPLFEQLASEWDLAEQYAYRGACAAARDRLDDARVAFVEAERRIDLLARPELLVASVHALGAFLDAAEARADPEQADRWMDRARARRATLERDTLLERSTHLRLIAGMLEGLFETNSGATYPASGSEVLRVGPDGSYFVPPGGERVELSARPRLATVLAVLVERRRQRPGDPLRPDEVLAGGWPGETVLKAAGKNRVYVTLSTLRKLGLGSVLLTKKGGYLLDPRVELKLLKSPGRGSD